MNFPPLWTGILRRLAPDLGSFAMEAWVQPLGAELDGGSLKLLCPSAFHRDRVRDRFLDRIARCAEAEAGRAVPVVLSVKSRRRAAADPDPVPDPDPDPAPKAPPRQQVLPYSFESFVVGPCNALAREACRAIADGSQAGLASVYLAGRAGLGKTHLARAAAASAAERGAARVLYTSAEAFTGEFQSAVRGGRMDAFKRRYRRGWDLLVLEDVQFLPGKRATQLELFHTIEHLRDAGARMVFTGDRPPVEIGDLDARLRSRMSGGLVAELEPPDARVRRRLLRTKAASGGVRLPDECLDLLVESLRGSVRDLEAVLIQLVATASLLKRPIDLDLTRASLRKMRPQIARRCLDPEAVIEVVARFFSTTPAALASRSRRRDVMQPRQIAMYLCRRYTDASLGGIARAFGRNHSSVTNAIARVERSLLERATARYELEAVSARLEEP